MAGNANSGRREQYFLTALLMELKAAGKDMPELRKIARILIDKSLDGDSVMMKELFDRLDGKPRQAIEHSGEIESTSREQREAAIAAALKAQEEDRISKLN